MFASLSFVAATGSADEAVTSTRVAMAIESVVRFIAVEDSREIARTEVETTSDGGAHVVGKSV